MHWNEAARNHQQESLGHFPPFALPRVPMRGLNMPVDQRDNDRNTDGSKRSKVRDLADEIVQLIEERQYRALKQLRIGTVELYGR